MYIGIIVYSHTGHTLTVAKRLEEKLSEAGHTVALTQLETVTPLKMRDTTATLKAIPPLDAYDALVFACPVRGGTPAPPMRVYLEQIPSLAGKNVACLVTGVFPTKWGRNQTLDTMQAICTSKGATICGTWSVWWPTKLGREREISQVVNDLSKSF